MVTPLFIATITCTTAYCRVLTVIVLTPSHSISLINRNVIGITESNTNSFWTVKNLKYFYKVYRFYHAGASIAGNNHDMKSRMCRDTGVSAFVSTLTLRQKHNHHMHKKGFEWFDHVNMTCKFLIIIILAFKAFKDQWSKWQPEAKSRGHV